MKIEGLKTIVTGGASGLGAATVRLLTAAGAIVAIFDVDDETGPALSDETGAIFFNVDVMDEQRIIDAMDMFADEDPARILVNCVGIAPDLLLTRREGPHRSDVFKRVLDVNVTGTFLTCAHFASRLRDVDRIGEEKGVIINTSSIAAFDGQVGHVAYSASKAAVAGMTLPMARDLARFHTRVMCIAPGVFDTPMLEDVHGISKKAMPSQIPHPERLGHPKEFAALTSHIIENPMLNGETIRLDGALRLGAH